MYQRLSFFKFEFKIKKKNKVVILGSGPLHEIPIEWLSRHFQQVILVDIVHLQSTKKSVSHLSNITFVQHDISELEEALQKGDLTPKIPTKKFTDNCSVVISANLLSQIPLHLKRYIDSAALRNKKDGFITTFGCIAKTSVHFKTWAQFTRHFELCLGKLTQKEE